jgi:hypothetical protein
MPRFDYVKTRREDVDPIPNQAHAAAPSRCSAVS